MASATKHHLGRLRPLQPPTRETLASATRLTALPPTREPMDTWEMHTYSVLRIDKRGVMRIETSAARFADLDEATNAANQTHAVDWAGTFNPPPGYAFGHLPSEAGTPILCVHPASATRETIRHALDLARRDALIVAAALLTIEATERENSL